MRYEMRDAASRQLLGTCDSSLSPGDLVVAFREGRVLVDLVPQPATAAEPVGVTCEAQPRAGDFPGRRAKAKAR